MGRVEYITNYHFSLKIGLGKPYREGGFSLCCGSADPQAGPTSGSWRGAPARSHMKCSSSSGQRAVQELRGGASCASASPVYAFSSSTAMTEH